MTWRMASTYMIANFCATLVAASSASSPQCMASDCDVPTIPDLDEERHIHLSLLQTSLHIDHSLASSKPARVELLSVKSETRATSTAKAALSHHMVHNVSCNPFLPIESRSKLEMLRHIGQLPQQTTCKDFSEALILPQVATSAVAQRVPTAAVIVVTYMVFVALVVACILRTLFAPTPASSYFTTKSPRIGSLGRPRPELEAWNQGLISWFLISWVSPWINKWGKTETASTTKIKAADLGAMGALEDETAFNAIELSRIWEEELKKDVTTWTMIRMLCRFSSYHKVVAVIVVQAFFQFLNYLCPPFAVHWILNYIVFFHEQRAAGIAVTSERLVHPLLMIILMFTGFVVFQACCGTFCFLLNSRINMRLQGGLGAMVYRKAQRLPAGLSSYDLRDEWSKMHKEEWGTGINLNESYSLVQLVTVDINGYLIGLIYLMSQVVTGVPLLCFLTWALIHKLGKATIVSICSIVVVTLIVRKVFVKQFTNLRFCQGWGGARVSKLQETLFGIRVIKSYAWEDRADSILKFIRQGELKYLWAYFGWSSIFFGILLTAPRMMVTIVLAAYSFIYGGIKAEDIFVLETLLFSFQGACQVFGNSLPMLLMAGPSLGRLAKFFNLPEAELPGSKREERQPWCAVWPAPPLPGDVRIGAKPPNLQVQGSFSWMKGLQPQLHDLDLCIEHGQRVAVVGGVGSGKSTLMHAMLGELAPGPDARLNLPERIAYHSQVAYICEGTLKENVLFHEAYDEQRYNQAIFAACLRQDLGVLPGGDGVPVGARGISLSGGQKARVSIARAAYNWGTEVVLLDDPFASLDATTGQHVLTHVVAGEIMKNRTIVVVMQPDAHALVQHFDKVVIMDNGTIVMQGAPKDVVESADFKRLLSAMDQQQVMEMTADCGDHSTPTTPRPGTPVQQSRDEVSAQFREEESEGRFDMATFKHYLNTGGHMLAFVCVVTFALQVVCNLLSDIMMANWTNAEVYGEIQQYTADGNVDASKTSVNMKRFLGGMTFWLVVSWFMFATSFYTGTTFTMKVSESLHESIMQRLLRAPIDRFYDKTPVGRILNRMSADLMQVDVRMYIQLTASIGQLVWWMVPMVYVHMAMPVMFSFFMVPWYWLIATVFRRYVNVVVPLRYLERVTRSEVNVFISEVENSKTTVRAYQVAKQFASAMMTTQDNMLLAQFASDCVKRWVSNRMLILYCFFSTSIALVGVLSPFNTSMGSVALCLSNAVGVIMKVDYVLDQLTVAQFQFISMNRLCEYLSIPQEREERLPGDTKLMNTKCEVSRDSLGKLESKKSEETGLITILQADQAGFVGDQVIFEELPGIKSFAFKSLRATSWLSKLRKSAENDQAGAPPNDDLDISHCLVAVNSALGDANAMAEELCHGTDGDVMLSFHSSWRMGGAHIKIENLVAGYADIPVNVLKDVSFTIERRNKVAICGTTGCGKSTTILCMLRILEPRSGKIFINHVNTQDIGLKALRLACGLVPQDPVVFAGTIRQNLDPYSEYPDVLIWNALKAVQLAEMVWLQGDGLQMSVAADGANLSFGQRQLLCVARMILRQPVLLLLDECTSAVDPKTQENVQRAIRTAFPSSTLMVIAHRLETILDFDRIVVLDKGMVAEQGPVKDLVALEKGLFAKMLRAHRKPQTDNL